MSQPSFLPGFSSAQVFSGKRRRARQLKRRKKLHISASTYTYWIKTKLILKIMTH